MAYTTRTSRPGENDAEAYFFVNRNNITQEQYNNSVFRTGEGQDLYFYNLADLDKLISRKPDIIYVIADVEGKEKIIRNLAGNANIDIISVFIKAQPDIMLDRVTTRNVEADTTLA
ncbi:MAG: hypothetical protein ACRCSG_00565 [Cellulosilyticaceae bacterium]